MKKNLLKRGCTFLESVIFGVRQYFITKNTDSTAAEKPLWNSYPPEKILIVYGTLAPNAPNHSVIEHIKGTWHKGIVRGKLEKKGWGAEAGYWGFRHVPTHEQEEIKAFILFSDELAANWAYIDDFEGHEYKRILAPFELDNNHKSIGFIYTINAE